MYYLTPRVMIPAANLGENNTAGKKWEHKVDVEVKRNSNIFSPPRPSYG
jgi:hypothetical protein